MREFYSAVCQPLPDVDVASAKRGRFEPDDRVCRLNQFWIRGLFVDKLFDTTVPVNSDRFQNRVSDKSVVGYQDTAGVSKQYQLVIPAKAGI
jgi:hypothetical protein